MVVAEFSTLREEFREIANMNVSIMFGASKSAARPISIFILAMSLRRFARTIGK
jgi:hypothetical protein